MTLRTGIVVPVQWSASWPVLHDYANFDLPLYQAANCQQMVEHFMLAQRKKAEQGVRESKGVMRFLNAEEMRWMRVCP